MVALVRLAPQLIYVLLQMMSALYHTTLRCTAYVLHLPSEHVLITSVLRLVFSGYLTSCCTCRTSSTDKGTKRTFPPDLIMPGLGYGS